MKVLFDHSFPFMMAHGGCQIQIERTKDALESVGVEVEFLRWWDGKQKGDLIHHFQIASNPYLLQARAARLPVIMTTLFTETCNRSDAQLKRQGWMVRTILKLPIGNGIKQQLNWLTFRNCTHNVVGLEAERQVLKEVYSVSDNSISLVPLGLSDTYLKAGAGLRSGDYLICTGTIVERKNCVPLAEMAHAAQVPLLFVGKPYHPKSPYWEAFTKLIDNRWVKHHPHVESESEMISLLQNARGFVLMSDYENWCLSAHEAAACGLPLLVQDQKWSRERFGSQTRYFSEIGNTSGNVEALKRFYLETPSLPAPKIQQWNWREVATILKSVYQQVLASSQT